MPKRCLLVRAAFGQQIELRRGARLARHEIDHAAVGVRAVDRRLRAANHLDAVQRFGGDVGEIEGAAESVHRDAIDLAPG